MKNRKETAWVAIVGLCLAGCQTQTNVPPPKPAPEPAPVVEPAPVAEKKPEPPPPAPVPKKRTQEQIQLLQDFAIKESPKTWQTIQSMRAEMTTSGAKLKQLRADLLEFDRDPDSDDTTPSSTSWKMRTSRPRSMRRRPAVRTIRRR